jgi:hypothetical protein
MQTVFEGTTVDQFISDFLVFSGQLQLVFCNLTADVINAVYITATVIASAFRTNLKITSVDTAVNSFVFF